MLQKINKHKINPIPVEKVVPDKIKGYDLIPKLYCNIFICAHKESGKTNAIFKILKECCGKKTKLFIISSTAFIDPNWIHIIKFFEKRGNNVTVSSSIENGEADFNLLIEELTKKGEDEIKKLKENDNVPENEEEVLSIPIDILDDETKEPKKPKKEQKEKKVAPEYIFVFDDMSKDLRNPNVGKLLKKHRHFKSKVIASSQYLKDMDVDSREQIEFWLLFGDHSDDNIKKLWENIHLRISFQLLLKLYHNATHNKYNFLFINRVKNEFCKNFTHKYILRNGAFSNQYIINNAKTSRKTKKTNDRNEGW
jgi:hypothetical protein